MDVLLHDRYETSGWPLPEVHIDIIFERLTSGA